MSLFSFLCESGAQGLPQLPVAPEISVSTFPNGIDCYLVNNSSRPGFADFALVQKGPQDVDLSRGGLRALDHFDGQAPYKYLASKGIGYGRKGYIESTDTYQAYRFDDVPVADKSVCDSMCVMLFDLASRFPQSQAVIISGDIDSKALKDRMTAISLLTGPRKAGARMPQFDFASGQGRTVVGVTPSVPSVASVSVSFLAPRPPAVLMNTVQPLMNQLYASILGIVLKTHVEQTMERLSVPLLESDFRYVNAAQSSREESYTFTLKVPGGREEDAVEALSCALSWLDEHGVSEKEYLVAKTESLIELTRPSSERMTNERYVQRCMASYLYGANLATEKTLKDFFDSRKLPGERETSLFNNYLQSLVSPDTNMSLIYDKVGKGLSEERIGQVFDKAWKEQAIAFREEQRPSSLEVPPMAKRKPLKLTFSTSEPITSGSLWTFSNGMNVIFKSVKGSGRFDFSMLLRGGYSSVPGLNPGEGAFVSDILGLSMEGMVGELRLRGIQMTPQVTLSDIRLTGSAPSGDLSTVLDALLSMSVRPRPDTVAFNSYFEKEPFRIDITRKRQTGLYEVMDSLLAPYYAYSTHKETESVQPGLQLRAEEFFKKSFSKFNDGVFVIVGDLDPAKTKELLSQMLAYFPTGPALSVRPLVEYPLRSGWSTYTVDAARSIVGNGEKSVNVAMSSFMPFSSSRYLAFRLALICVQKKIVLSLADTGMYAEIAGTYDVFPAEKVNLYISVRPCESSGLPSGIVPSEPLMALGDTRLALSRIIARGLTDAELASYKAVLISDMKAESQSPEKMVENALTRYSLGKDLISGYESKVKQVTADQVKDMLRVLDNGAKVEYIIY